MYKYSIAPHTLIKLFLYDGLGEPQTSRRNRYLYTDLYRKLLGWVSVVPPRPPPPYPAGSYLSPGSAIRPRPWGWLGLNTKK